MESCGLLVGDMSGMFTKLILAPQDIMCVASYAADHHELSNADAYPLAIQSTDNTEIDRFKCWAQWQTQADRSSVRKAEDCIRAELCGKYGIDYATLTRLQQEGQSTPISRHASFQHGHKLNLQGPISFKITSSQQQKASRLEQDCSLSRTATTLRRTRLFGYLCKIVMR